MAKKSKNKRSNVKNIPANSNLRAVPRNIDAPPNSLREVSEMIETAKELAETQINVAKDWLKEKEIKHEEFLEVYERYGNEEKGIPTEFVEYAWNQAFGEDCVKFLEEYRNDQNAEASDTELKKLFIDDAFVQWKPAAETTKELAELEGEFGEFKQSNAEYFTSKEFDMERENNLIKFKKRLESMEAFNGNPSDIKKMKRLVRVMEERFSPDYLLDEFTSELVVVGKKSARDRLVDNFFNKDQSNYTVRRFKDKCKSLRISSDVLFRMINLEENYLEPEYHVFNNFYIFMLMMYTNHNIYDIKDVREIKYPVQNILNLVYNKFYSEEIKETFLNHMRRFLDLFESYHDLFEKSNQLQPTHPHRIQKDAERAAMEKELKYAQLASEFPEEAAKLIEEKPLAEIGLTTVLDTLYRCRAAKESADAEEAMVEVDEKIAEVTGEAEIGEIVPGSDHDVLEKVVTNDVIKIPTPDVDLEDGVNRLNRTIPHEKIVVGPFDPGALSEAIKEADPVMVIDTLPEPPKKTKSKIAKNTAYGNTSKVTIIDDIADIDKPKLHQPKLD